MLPTYCTILPSRYPPSLSSYPSLSFSLPPSLPCPFSSSCPPKTNHVGSSRWSPRPTAASRPLCAVSPLGSEARPLPRRHSTASSYRAVANPASASSSCCGTWMLHWPSLTPTDTDSRFPARRELGVPIRVALAFLFSQPCMLTSERR